MRNPDDLLSKKKADLDALDAVLQQAAREAAIQKDRPEAHVSANDEPDLTAIALEEMEEEQRSGLTSAISISQKVSTGSRYEPAELFISLSGIRADTTEEDIDEALNVTNLAYNRIVARIRKRVKRLRAGEAGGTPPTAYQTED